MQTQQFIQQIFNTTSLNFNEVLNLVFQYQCNNNLVYSKWVNLLQNNRATNTLLTPTTIPYLPISFFKSHKVVCGTSQAQQVFESSGTTTTINSQHFVNDIEIYKKSFIKAFTATYGDIEDWCFIGLLPSYLERNNSSLVFMVDELIRLSKNECSGFYLNDFKKLHTTLMQLEIQQQKTIVIGVTFALLDFAERYKMNLQHTIVMETGGMKGRKKEMTKDEVHQLLMQQLGVQHIHSEYGMTELLSQAYSTKNNIYTCPPWLKVVVRSEEDPMQISFSGRGIINIIDLANVESCSFIATDDVGEVFEDGSFSIYGRLDSSDLRGCSLLYL